MPRTDSVSCSIGSRRASRWRSRRGKIVAYLAPPGGAFNAEAARAAAERIRLRRRGVTLGGSRISDLIDEGRM
jgi:hypothetical protein